MDFNEYWRENTFELNRRVNVIRNLLKIEEPYGPQYRRFGTPNDGGYVLHSDFPTGGLDLISLGVERNVDFEVDMSKYTKRIHMYDYSVDGPPKEVPNGEFFKEKIGINPGEISLDECVYRIVGDSSLILKMDIEGSEWDVLAASKMLGAFCQITVEMHWMLNIVYDAFYDAVVRALSNLRQTHYPVLVHANNDQPLLVMGANPIPNVFEVLYLNKIEYPMKPREADPFEGLVVTNNPTFPEIGLTFP